jgi:uncharacterized protein YjbI with pentapeptide repeats
VKDNYLLSLCPLNKSRVIHDFASNRLLRKVTKDYLEVCFMGELVCVKKYISTNNHSREREDFTYTLFENIDFRKEDKPTSFFRSDFRGAKFVNVIFYLNNFDRADFISCVFINCQFINVNVATCEIKNCYFNNVEFITNNYNNTSIQECTFYKCEFKNENLLINMKNCNFSESRLFNCKFERSTTEKIFLEKCVVSSVDFANMHAERYSFKSCELVNVDIDICYIFGYLFYDTNIYDINIIYMGKKIEMSKENMLNRFACNLWAQQRYYEYINAKMLFDNIKCISQLIKKAFYEINKNTDYSTQLETLNIFDLLQFYSMCNMFDFDTLKDILNFLNNFDWGNFNSNKRIIYLTQVQRLELYLKESIYDEKFINSANTNISLVTFYCNTNDYNMAISTIKQCLNKICLIFGFSDSYEVIHVREGSWIITVAVITSCALLLPKVFKKYANVIIEISIKTKISRKIADKLNMKKLNINDFRKITDIASASGIISQTVENLDLSDISKIVDMLKIKI